MNSLKFLTVKKLIKKDRGIFGVTFRTTRFSEHVDGPAAVYIKISLLYEAKVVSVSTIIQYYNQ